MVEYRTSIEALHKVFPTSGSSPVLVTCDDLEDWVCKYDQSFNSLLNEFLASRFLDLWGISTPKMSLITVMPEHIPDRIIGGRLQPRFFRKHCFGSKFLTYAKEIDEFFLFFKNRRHALSKLNPKSDFLRIGLFDLWVSNEDRHQNNYNLLINPEPNGTYRFYAIDHVNLFNGGNLRMAPCHLADNESILTSNVANVLYKKGTKLKETVDNLVKDMYLCAGACHANIKEIVEDLPETWDIDRAQVLRDLEQIFKIGWLKQTEQVFRKYVQMGIR